MGFITQVKLINNSQNHKKIIIDNNTENEYILEGFFPLREGDIIHGFVDKESLQFIRPPLIQISTNKSSILTMMSSFRIKGVQPKTWENIYNRINNLSNDNPVEVVNTLSKWAHQYSQYQNLDMAIPASLKPILSDKQWKIFLDRFNSQYAMRSLYLLGLSKQDIMKSKNDYVGLYNRCLKNPWSSPCIPLDKCELIDQRLNRNTTEEQRICGKILRSIYQRTWEGMNTYQVYSDYKKMFPEIIKFKDILIRDYQIEIEDNERLYYAPIYYMEVYVADFITNLILENSPPLIEPVYELETLTEEQKEAINIALNTNFSFYTGGPGVGKSTIIKEIVRNNDLIGVHYVLCSFTGKAVARMKEITGKPAYTMDMLMAKDIMDEVDHIIIDEISMTSLELLYRFFNRLSKRKDNLPKITLVGDQNQLSPIGFGYPFREIMKLNEIPRVFLTKNYRLDTDDPEEHGVMLACQSIMDAPPCRLKSCEGFSIAYGDEKTVIDIFKHFKENGFNQNDIVCITPYNKCVNSINPIVSELFHPESEKTDPKETLKGVCWRVGDKIIVNTNIYSIGIYNGEEGEIIRIDELNVYISFLKGKKRAGFRYKKINEYGEEVEDEDEIQDKNFDGEEQELTTTMISHGYAFSIHRSQGSQFPYVICYYPMIQGKGNFICKELIFTQFSRCESGAYLVIPKGGLRGLEIAAGKSTKDARLDFLAERIKKNMI